MRSLAIMTFVVLSNAVHADDVPPIKAPAGWNSEKLDLPTSFAPTMKLKGVEDIRFAPGMLKPKSDSFFSYTILFWVPEKQVVTQKLLEQELLTYYQGLCKAVLRDQRVDTSKFTMVLKPVKQPAKAPKPAFLNHDRQDFTGKLTWVEPFVTKKSQTLVFDVQSWHCPESKHRAVFICVSPQPKTATIWKSMRDIRAAFRCHAK